MINSIGSNLPVVHKQVQQRVHMMSVQFASRRFPPNFQMTLQWFHIHRMGPDRDIIFPITFYKINGLLNFYRIMMFEIIMVNNIYLYVPWLHSLKCKKCVQCLLLWRIRQEIVLFYTLTLGLTLLIIPVLRGVSDFQKDPLWMQTKFQNDYFLLPIVWVTMTYMK